MEDLENMNTEAATVAELAKLADGVVPAMAVTSNDGRAFIIYRNDFSVIDKTLPHAQTVLMPKIVTQHVQIQTSGSMKEYVNRFKDEDTIMFADINANRIVAHLDYREAPVQSMMHEATEDQPASASPSVGAQARLLAHSASLNLPFSKEWQTWTAQNERLMKHLDFASFLEENAFDVLEPFGGDLLDIVRDLAVKQNMNFTQAIRFGDTVKVAFQKEDDVSTKQEFELPTEITIAIPVYFGETAVSIRCLMRRKVDNGQLFLGFKMIRLEQIRQDEFKRIVNDIRFDTSNTPTVYGSSK